MNENITSTKFIFCVLSLALAYPLIFIGKITADQFLGFVEWVGSSYILGNVAAKYINSKSAD